MTHSYASIDIFMHTCIYVYVYVRREVCHISGTICAVCATICAVPICAVLFELLLC